VDTEIRWLDDEKTILLHYTARLLTEGELIESTGRIPQMLDTVSHPVYIIGDADPHMPPPRFSPLRVLESIFRKILSHPNAHMLFIVGGNAFVRVIGSVVIKYMRKQGQVVFCKTRDEALKHIQQHRTTQLT